MGALKYNFIPEWDLVAHRVLMSDLATEFVVMLDTDDFVNMSSVAMAK